MTERDTMKLPFETDKGIGVRATLGLIILQGDETFEHEMALLLPSEGGHSIVAFPWCRKSRETL